MPEKAIQKISARIRPQWKICFFAAVLVGLLAHLYKITSWLPNWDSLVFRYDPQNMLSMGRWFLPVVCSFSSFYDLPLLNGVLALFFHALGAVYICRILNIQKNITAFLIGAVVVSFPTVTSVMMYNYVADGYSVAFFLSVLAAWLMTKERPRYVLAVIFIALSTGIYQAYITVTVMLVLIKLIDELVFHHASVATILKKTGRMLLVGAAGVAVYGIILKVLLTIFSMELIEYQGVKTTASFSNINLLASLYVVKDTFVKAFFDFSKGANVYAAVNCFVAVFTVGYYLIHFVGNRLYKNAGNVILVVIFWGSLIIGAGALAFINPAVDYHNLMRMGYCVFYLFFIVLYERGVEKKQKHTNIKCWIVLLTAAAIISNQVVVANISYHKAQMAYERSYGVLVRIADRIEQTPEAENCQKLLVLGALENSEQYSVNLTPDITGITDGYIIRADDEIVGQSVLCSALSDYCGKNYAFVSGNAKKLLCQRDDVKSMGNWPSKDSIAVVDGTLIIKLSAEGERN